MEFTLAYGDKRVDYLRVDGPCVEGRNSTELATPRTSTHAGAEGPSAAATIIDSYPTLSTRRFQFRPFRRTDIGHLASLAVEQRGTDATVGIPNPYTAEFARMWISSHSSAWAGRRALHWAALRNGEDRIVGYAGLNEIDMERGQAELRFWVGCSVERKNDAVEWSAAIVRFALTHLNLNRIYALQLSRHPVAGHVLAAVGMRREGLVRKRIYKGGLVEDVICWAIARSDP
jgi:RimJ/RimL family protein N-acetyltransferase